MSNILSFILGIIFGGVVVYLIIHTKEQMRPWSGIAYSVEKQHDEKEARKEKIIEVLRTKEKIKNKDVEALLGVADATATNYLQELEREGKIKQVGERGRFVSYRLKK